ncbi:hypothetical protein B0H66DRAFT_472613 [Apodospora peruviana]|uniref:Uncharacterized protein n=1 Tax=Apodospora peruviana TaxID=516989 RepID=A0AAE0MBU1_9PEZI|nr:hypothetical protein B0H66DRAFT_472613 [Apodospora peruviana]
MGFRRPGDIEDATPTNAKASKSTDAIVILPLTPHPASILSPSRDDPETPSSTLVEFGDLGKDHPQAPSAAELAENVYRSYSRAQAQAEVQQLEQQPERPESRTTNRSQSQASQQRKGRDDGKDKVRADTPIVGPRNRSQSASRRGLPDNLKEAAAAVARVNGNEKAALLQERELANSKVNRFLHQMAQQDPPNAEKELLQENRSLYQRISTLQRIEREMLAENQDLMRQYQALRQHHDIRRRQWRDDYRLREKAFATRLQQLKEQIAQQETQMLQMSRTHTKKIAPLLSDMDIVKWFADKDAAWYGWAKDNAFHDSSQLLSKLHPLQLEELCEGVKDFVKLTADGRLPDEILAGGTEMVPTLLHGMVTNFICNEALASPFWVFSAIGVNALESPSVAAQTSNSPVGFRMDLAMFSDIAPMRSAACAHTPGSPLFPPPLITSLIPPLGINTKMVSMGLPMRPEMENMYHMLAQARKDDSEVTVHHWRAQMMRLLAESGIAIRDPKDDPSRHSSKNEAARLLIETRQNYAHKLRERFLGGAARYLLKDQTAAGIEKLERRLTEQIDDALRFGCQVWSRPTPLRLQGWPELGAREFRSTSQIVELCHAQAPPQNKAEALLDPETPPPGYYDGRSVLMVVQPAIEAVGLEDNDDHLNPEDGPKVWIKARVVVSVTEPTSAPTNDTETPAVPAPDYEKVEGQSGRRGQAEPLPSKILLKVVTPSQTTNSPNQVARASPITAVQQSHQGKNLHEEKPVRAMELLASSAFNPFPSDPPKIALTAPTPPTERAPRAAF